MTLARRPWAGFGWIVLAFSLWGCGPAEGPSPPARGAFTPIESHGLDRPATPKALRRGMIGDRLSGMRPQTANPTIPQEPSPFRFTDVRAGSGVDFVHVSGMTPEKHFPTANGSGLAVFDFDGDGLMDLYFASFNLIPPGSPMPGRNRLYRNLGGLKFADVTDAAGVGFVGRCHGALAADIDSDGDQDLFLCNYGPNVLYQNQGDGTFKDISKSAGIDRPAWSSGGACFDADDDGDLDLYVSTYGTWEYPRDDEFCGDVDRKLRLYCSPRKVLTAPHLFYRNNGDGTFTEAAEAMGFARPEGKRGHGFGVVAADLNADGKIDVYVANDMNPNFLFLNQGNGTFHDATEESNAAYDDKGNAQSGMGVDAEDVDGDGLPELFVTNFSNEYNTLYQNLGKGMFYDQTPIYGLAADSMPWVGWGCGLVDFDNDGWPDSFVTNGHVDDNREGVPYKEPPLLHRNVGLGSDPSSSRRFKLATRDAGDYFASAHVGRGAAFGDLDNDGDIDIVVNHKDAPPAILRNDTPTAHGAHHAIQLKLTGTRGNRDAVGARVEVVADDRTIVRQRKGGSSMESSHDPRLLIGIGAAESAKVTIRWPRGAVTTREQVAPGKLIEIVEPESDQP